MGRQWVTRWTAAEAQIARDLLPWGECCRCGERTQWRVLERAAGVPTGVEWFVCDEHLPE